jgi:hypothetical protein
MLPASPTHRGCQSHEPCSAPRLRRQGGRLLALFGLSLVLLITLVNAMDEPVTVRHREGLVHGFLVLRTLDGKALADGDLIQRVRGTRVTTRLVFRFKDGSVHDDTAVFDQERQFRLVSDHLIQKGPTFPQPLDMSIDGMTGEVTVKYTDDDGQQKMETEHLEAAPDLANGIVSTVLKNVSADAHPKTLSFVAATPKPQLVNLAVSVAGTERFSTGSTTRTATHYVLKVNIGGIKGLLAPLVGKQPPDSHVWILEGEAPAFLKAEQPFFAGGPVWRIELISPAWPGSQPSGR